VRLAAARHLIALHAAPNQECVTGPHFEIAVSSHRVAHFPGLFFCMFCT
jgi:hypothetical protein